MTEDLKTTGQNPTACCRPPQRYIGVKIVNATLMNRFDYNDYRKWKLPDDENGTDEGYLVEYQNDSGSNHPNHVGYISWCPKAQFEEANRLANGMPFGHAIEAAKLGYKIARVGWNGKGMFVAYMSGMSLPAFNDQNAKRKVNDRTAVLIGKDTPLETLPYFAMWTADKKWLPGWLASQTDMLADDWMVIED